MTGNLGHLLWQARLDGRQVDRPGLLVLADAYAIQSEQITASGLAVGGWKIGATNKASQSMLGLDAPFAGPVFKRDIYRNGAEVPIFAGQDTGLECEFGLELAEDIAAQAKPYTPREISSAIAAVRPSFEIVALRFTGGAQGAGPLLIADGGANHCIVVGDPFTDLSRLDFSNHGLSVAVSGRPVTEGNSKVSMWDQLVDAVIWLAAQEVISPRGLRAGDIIMTGTCAGLIPIKPGDKASADFGAVGKVTAQFVEAAPPA